MSEMSETSDPQDPPCDGCGRSYPTASLSCPNCQRLRYAARLKQVAAEAQRAAQAGDNQRALTLWRDALAMLPDRSKQHSELVRRIQALVASTQAQPADGNAAPAAPFTPATPVTRVTPDKTGSRGAPAEAGQKKRGLPGLAGLGAIGLMIWKFKWIAAAVLSKGKFLLGGLTKMSTVFSMLATMGLYWNEWGWQFAVGLVLCIYIHEMGHVMALRRLGIAASAPMFIPGLGAMVRMKQYPATSSEDAQVGLAGPVWGLGAAVACYGIYLASDSVFWLVLARLGGLLNLFNLIPFWQLDGGRAFRALTKRQCWWAAGAIGVAWFISEHALLALIGLAAVYRAGTGEHPTRPDQRALTTYIGLIATLTWLTALEIPFLDPDAARGEW